MATYFALVNEVLGCSATLGSVHIAMGKICKEMESNIYSIWFQNFFSLIRIITIYQVYSKRTFLVSIKALFKLSRTSIYAMKWSLNLEADGLWLKALGKQCIVKQAIELALERFSRLANKKICGILKSVYFPKCKSIQLPTTTCIHCG